MIALYQVPPVLKFLYLNQDYWATNPWRVAVIGRPLACAQHRLPCISKVHWTVNQNEFLANSYMCIYIYVRRNEPLVSQSASATVVLLIRTAG